MSLRLPKSELEEDKLSLAAEDNDSHTSPVTTQDTVVKAETTRGFLRAPISGPIRPFSPDTLSNLSVDEYEQIGPGRHTDHVSRASRLPGETLAPPRGLRARWKALWVRNKGLAYMLLAQVFGTLMNVTTRLLEVEGNHGKGLHPFQILFARMGITFVLASGYMWYKKTPYFPLGMPEVRWLLVARGLVGLAGVYGMYYSLLYLPLADATVITFLAPGLACWACSILINEPFTRVEQMGSLVSLLGVVLIARPASLFANSSRSVPSASGTEDGTLPINDTASATEPDFANYDNVTPTQRLMAVAIAMVGVLGAAGAYTTIRWIGKRAHPLISVNYFAVWCTFVSIVMQLALPGVGFLLPQELKEWGYLFFLGICGFVMQFLLAAGLSYEKSSRPTNMCYTQMLFALSFDKLIFGHTPGWMSIIGSSLILGSAVFVAIQKDAEQSREQIESTQAAVDEECQQGLMSGMDVETGDDHDRVVNGQSMPLQQVQMMIPR